MKNIYLEIERRLNVKVPELRMIDMESGQIDAYREQRPPVDYPLALVRISYPRCEDVSRTEQNRQVRIEIRLAWEAWMNETSNRTPGKWKNRALDKIDLVEKIADALQGWGGTCFETLSLVSVIPQDRADGLMVYRLTFDSSFESEVK